VYKALDLLVVEFVLWPESLCRVLEQLETVRSCSIGINRLWLVGFFRVLLGKTVFVWFG